MKKISLLLLSVLFVLSCKKEEKLTFTEVNILLDENAFIEINIPLANENSDIGNSINTAIDNHIVNTLNFSEDNSESIILSDAIKKFKADYLDFKAEFEGSTFIWEATFDGEIIYQTKDIISVALSSYMNTGGAHGNTTISLLNFNPQTGSTYVLKDLIKDEKEFTKLVEVYFIEELQLKTDSEFEGFFFGEDFRLPENISFNDEGLLILYNAYEIASFDQGITEFTIPLDKISHLLNVY